MKSKTIKNYFPQALAYVLLALLAEPGWAASWNPASSDSKGNTAGGSNALSSITGSGTTGFGYNALKANTSAGYGSAFGYGALAANTTGGANIAIGYIALGRNTTGGYNTVVGAQSMYNNTTGSYNLALGLDALVYNTTGNNNTAVGTSALQANTTGGYNVGVGYMASASQTTANYNTALGYLAAYSTTTGTNNIAIGYKGGYDQTTGSYNIYLGNTGVAAESRTIRIGDTSTQTAAYLAGVKGASVTGSSASAVYIDSTGKLGTLSSSQRFKRDIRDMSEASQGLLRLRPVTFRYKEAAGGSDNALEYGLIAEEVAKVYPDLVLRDDKGAIQTVQYHKLTPMLLNEVQRLSRSLQAEQAKASTQAELIKAQTQELANLRQQITQVQAQARQMEALSARLAKLEGKAQAEPVIKTKAIQPEF